MGTGGNNVPLVRMTMLAHTKQNMKQRTQDRDCTWTLDTSSSKMAIHHNNLRLRKLTPTECERLQGLPDGFTRWLKNGAGNITENSDSDRYERCGRTVTSTVIEAIGGRLGYDWW